MPGKLTTHVLDTAQGRPAAGVVIEVRAVSDGNKVTPIKTVTTNADGRTDNPVLTEDELVAGIYELAFFVGDYFARQSTADPTRPRFLDVVPVRFGIANRAAHYHVPLLVSPFGYSTYRGS